MDSTPESCCKSLDKLQEKAIRIIHYRKMYMDGKRLYKNVDVLMKKYKKEKEKKNTCVW